ncbi:MAG: OmpA family protein [Bacteroidales bacterium]
MKAIFNFKIGSRMNWFAYTLKIKSLIIGVLILTGTLVSLQAQETQYTRPSWWFGAAGGANLDFYRGSTQQINLDLTVPTVFHDGSGVGLYLAPLLEFYRPESVFGLMLQAGYDNRKGSFDQVLTPCNCPADLSANLSYITVEPSLRVAPFKSDFYLYAGPRFAFNLGKSFVYEVGLNPDFPEQLAEPDVTGDFHKIYPSLISMQIGAGYDIQLSSQDNQTQAVLSPFVSFHPYFGQDPRSIETWNITTVRVGAALKFGRGKKISDPPVIAPPVDVIAELPEVDFTVYSPANIPSQRRVRETFPILNYVYFDLGSTEIPDRYVLLSKAQVKDFKEDRLEVFAPKHLSGRSQRQMTVYYNVLNILGDRMAIFPATKVNLTGSSMDGKSDGLEMAESVKKYLVDVFSIDPKRITTEGSVKPLLPEEQPGGTDELVLLRQGDHRVTIMSESPELIMEYQTGPDVPLKPIEIITVQEAPPDSYVLFSVDGAKKEFSSWSLEVRDEKGALQKFGPYTQENVSIPGKAILGSRASGDYKITVVGKTRNGKTVKEEVPVQMVLWTPAEDEQGMRYNIVYEFNIDEAIATYEKYLTEIVTPKIPKNGTVIIHGHTDLIGDAGHNRELSLARANDVGDIIKRALSAAGRKDVKFEVYGFGEDDRLSPFDNKYPEERSYNRSVIIDIIPPK